MTAGPVVTWKPVPIETNLAPERGWPRSVRPAHPAGRAPPATMWSGSALWVIGVCAARGDATSTSRARARIQILRLGRGRGGPARNGRLVGRSGRDRVHTLGADGEVAPGRGGG